MESCNRGRFTYFLWLLALCLSLMANPGVAGGLERTKAGTLKVVSGTVSIHRDKQNVAASAGTAVFEGDVVVTGQASFAGITLLDNTRLTAGPASRLVIDAFSFDTTTHEGEVNTRVQKGSLAVISGLIAKTNPDKVVFNTGTMTIGVRGTEFIIEAQGE